jgi:hypothetical protein
LLANAHHLADYRDIRIIIVEDIAADALIRRLVAQHLNCHAWAPQPRHAV